MLLCEMVNIIFAYNKKSSSLLRGYLANAFRNNGSTSFTAVAGQLWHVASFDHKE